MADITLAFKYKKPAVISSHRVNYTGGLDKKNREFGNHQLALLLNEIMNKWSDVEFLTSVELGNFLK